jgi:hypothetical protein
MARPSIIDRFVGNIIAIAILGVAIILALLTAAYMPEWVPVRRSNLRVTDVQDLFNGNTYHLIKSSYESLSAEPGMLLTAFVITAVLSAIFLIVYLTSQTFKSIRSRKH